MPKKKTPKQTLTIHVQIKVDASHIVPGSEAYPDQKTLKECLKQEFRWCQGKDGQGDYLDMLMAMDGSHVIVNKLCFKRDGQEDITITGK